MSIDVEARLPSGAYARVKDPLLGAAHFDERTDRYVVAVSDALAALDRLAAEYARLVPAEDEGRLREAERVRRAIYSVWPGLSQADAQLLVDALAATPEPGDTP